MRHQPDTSGSHLTRSGWPQSGLTVINIFSSIIEVIRRKNPPIKILHDLVFSSTNYVFVIGFMIESLQSTRKPKGKITKIPILE